MLTQAIRLTSGLTELILVFNTWVISLPADPRRGHRVRDAVLRQTLRTFLYAVSEPMYTWLLLHTKLAPPILLLGTSSIHLTMATSFTNSLNMLVANTHAAASNMSAPDIEKPLSSAQSLEQPSGSELLDESHTEYDRICSVFEYIFTQTSAASNASLLLLSQYMMVLNGDTPSTPTWLTAFSLILFLVSRMVDYSMASLTQRPSFIGQRGVVTDTLRQIQFLILYLVWRSAVRLSLGMASLGMFEQATVLENTFRPGRDAWWQEFVLKLPAGTSFALSALSVVLTIASQYYWARAERRVRETGQ